MQSIVESLDMKIDHCRDAKAKEMCLEVIEGRIPPDSSWMGYLIVNGQWNFWIDFDSTPVYVHVLTVFILYCSLYILTFTIFYHIT